MFQLWPTIEYLADETEPERCRTCAEVRQSVKVEPAQIEEMCWSCGSELTGRGNSDGRAEELRDIAVYTCAKCLPAPDEWAGTFIGNYEVVRLLGKGGMGAVYLVYHRPTAQTDGCRSHTDRWILLPCGIRLDPEVHSTPLHAGDLVLLCSDGLWEALSDEEINTILAWQGSMRQRATRSGGLQLVDRANEAGGPDNITVLYEHVVDGRKNDELAGVVQQAEGIYR